uniref:Prolyl endopeptidase n=1 Tax=Parastrongyloides trichosuri TaxID=131310 RepID=A0A0N4ZL25_PARTI
MLLVAIITTIIIQYQFVRLGETSSIVKPYETITDGTTIKVNVTRYPLIRKDETIVEILHGTKVSDPYRYLEDPTNVETKNFINKLNTLTSDVLSQSKYKDMIKEKIISYFNFEKYGIFEKYGDYYYYSFNPGLDNQNSIYRKKNLSDKGEKFIDVNSFSPDGLISLSFFKTSLDGKLIAYGLSSNGSDWNEIHFMDVHGNKLNDIIKQVKHSEKTFVLNGKGFVYSTYPNRKETDDGTTVDKNEYHSLYYHEMGTDSKNDIIIGEYKNNKDVLTAGYTLSNSNGRYLFVDFINGTDTRNIIYYYDLKNVNEIKRKLDWKPLFDKGDASYSIFDVNDEEVYIKTDKDAPMGKIFRMKISDAPKGESSWVILVDENKNKKIEEVITVGDKYFLCNYLEDVKSTLYIHDKETGKMIQQIDIEPGLVDDLHSHKGSNEFFVSFNSQVSPTTIYKGNLDVLERGEKVKLQIIVQTKPTSLNLNEFSVKQEFYKSKDGTKVPMFIFHNKNLKLDGTNPVLLEGYGGYGISNIPSYSASRTMFVKHFGGIIVTANIRGGGEYGEEWHKNGMLHKKQNTFDDFIAGAEYLIQKNYTKPSKLGIRGGSNGGLLMGAVSQQRPDLFGGVINQVGALDMLRFHKFTSGGAWISEYGDPDVKEDFDYLLTYSPYHNLKLPKNKIQWPSTLLETGDHDDRVVPSHTLKYMARLYEILQDAKDYQTNPVLASVEKSAGHGSGTPLSKNMDELVREFSFLELALNLKWRD